MIHDTLYNIHHKGFRLFAAGLESDRVQGLHFRSTAFITHEQDTPAVQEWTQLIANDISRRSR